MVPACLFLATSREIADSAGAPAVLDALYKRWRWLKRLFADNAYEESGQRRQPLREVFLRMARSRCIFDFPLAIEINLCEHNR